MVDVILIPGLWLDEASWAPVTEALEAAGHRAHPLTMPGVGEPAPGSSGVRMDDWVDAVVRRIDAVAGPVVVVGHSGGGNVAYGAAGHRPERITEIVLVDAFPPNDGQSISEFEVVDGVVPFPGWDVFDPEDVADLDETARARIEGIARSVPAAVPTDPVRLTDERRNAIPLTLLSGPRDEAQLRAFLAQWPGASDALDAVASVQVVHLDTGHWPQFTKPDLVADEIVKAAGRAQ